MASAEHTHTPPLEPLHLEGAWVETRAPGGGRRSKAREHGRQEGMWESQEEIEEAEASSLGASMMWLWGVGGREEEQGRAFF